MAGLGLRCPVLGVEPHQVPGYPVPGARYL